MHGARGFAGGVPGDHHPVERGSRRTGMRDHQRRPPGFHEGGLDEQRVVAAARLGIGLTDDDKIAVAGVARQKTGQPVERAALLEDAEGCAAELGISCHAGENLVRCRVSQCEMLVDDVGRSVPAGAAHKGLGDQVERGDPGAELLGERESEVEAGSCGGRRRRRAPGCP